MLTTLENANNSLLLIKALIKIKRQSQQKRYRAILSITTNANGMVSMVCYNAATFFRPVVVNIDLCIKSFIKHYVNRTLRTY